MIPFVNRFVFLLAMFVRSDPHFWWSAPIFLVLIAERLFALHRFSPWRGRHLSLTLSLLPFIVTLLAQVDWVSCSSSLNRQQVGWIQNLLDYISCRTCAWSITADWLRSGWRWAPSLLLRQVLEALTVPIRSPTSPPIPQVSPVVLWSLLIVALFQLLLCVHTRQVLFPFSVFWASFQQRLPQPWLRLIVSSFGKTFLLLHCWWTSPLSLSEIPLSNSLKHEFNLHFRSFMSVFHCPSDINHNSKLVSLPSILAFLLSRAISSKFCLFSKNRNLSDQLPAIRVTSLVSTNFSLATFWSICCPSTVFSTLYPSIFLLWLLFPPISWFSENFGFECLLAASWNKLLFISIIVKS